MTLDQLKILTHIVEKGGIIAAAEALNRTQPTVSVAIKKLEVEFNLEIFSRDQYRVSLTPAGKKLYQRAKLILDQTKSFEQLASQLSAGNEPEIKIAIEVSCPIPSILQILRKFEKEHSCTQLSLMIENVWGPLELVSKGHADLVISPWFENNLSLETIFFSNTTLQTVASPHFPLCQENRKLYSKDLKNHVQIVLKDSSKEHNHKSYGVLEGGRNWLVNDPYTKKEIILSGMGWGRLPQHVIKEELKTGSLIPLHIQDYELYSELELRVARKPDQSIGPIAQALWSYFEEFKKGELKEV